LHPACAVERGAWDEVLERPRAERRRKIPAVITSVIFVIDR
jgi:hypothetical protein